MSAQFPGALQKAVRALNSLDRDDPPANGDGALPDIERAQRAGRGICCSNISLVGLAWLFARQGPFRRKQIGHNLVRADNTNALSLNSANKHAQEPVIAPRQCDNRLRQMPKQRKTGTYFPPTRPPADCTRQHEVVHAKPLEERDQFGEVSETNLFRREGCEGFWVSLPTHQQYDGIVTLPGEPLGDVNGQPPAAGNDRNPVARAEAECRFFRPGRRRRHLPPLSAAEA